MVKANLIKRCLRNHWLFIYTIYISAELTLLSVFDDKVSKEAKVKIVDKEYQNEAMVFGYQKGPFVKCYIT